MTKCKMYKRGSPTRVHHMLKEEWNLEKHYGYDRMNLDLLVVAAAKELDSNYLPPPISSFGRVKGESRHTLRIRKCRNIGQRKVLGQPTL